MPRPLLLALSMVVLMAGVAFAGDHDRARKAVLDGSIVPLEEVIATAKAAIGGQIVEAELEDEGSALVYEIKMITPAGKVVKVYYDARNGQELRRKERK
jgi:uncharacterized membrane protein YkoI